MTKDFLEKAKAAEKILGCTCGAYQNMHEHHNGCAAIGMLGIKPPHESPTVQKRNDDA